MSAERRRQIEQIYRAALERQPKDRGEFIEEACKGDSELRGELELLLAHTGVTATFLEETATELGPHPSVDDHGGQRRPESGRSSAGLRPRENKDSRSRPRRPWWMYLIAIPFLAKAVFMTAFCFSGPEPMGIEVRPTRTHPVISNVDQDSPADRAEITGAMLS